ncbi:DUF2304 family protein [Patescibacteria group bacterium]|nr:DUF2304 family protein [Patescibacteria group bacterium]
MTIQIILVIFILFALSRVVLRFRDKQITIGELIVWSIFWIAVVVVIILPNTTNWLANALGVGRGVDAVIYLAVIVVFYANFRLGVKIEHIQREITQIVRKQALKDLNQEQDENNDN